MAEPSSLHEDMKIMMICYARVLFCSDMNLQVGVFRVASLIMTSVKSNDCGAWGHGTELPLYKHHEAVHRELCK